MTDRTQEVIDLYKKCGVCWDERWQDYKFCVDENNYIISGGNSLGARTDNSGSIFPEHIDHENLEIKKIRKRLEFLNKL